jgi:hypothetical protein
MEEMIDIMRLPNRDEDEARSAEETQREEPAERNTRRGLMVTTLAMSRFLLLSR